MSNSVRVDTTISREFSLKIKAFRLEKGMFAEAMRRGLTNIFDERQGNNTVYIPKEKREIVAHPSVINRIHELVELLDKEKIENIQLKTKFGVK